MKLKTQFEQELKRALVQRESASFVYLNNFEVEEHWKQADAAQMPSISMGSSKKIVNRMEEMGLLLASENDYVILQKEVDHDYLEYLVAQGFSLPKLLCLPESDPEKTISENILASREMIDQLKSLSSQELYLMPFGVSSFEEEVSERTGIPLSVPKSCVFERVNSKIYSRRLNAELGITEVPGACCESAEELCAAFDRLKPLLDEGHKIVIKDAYGVSGKGITVVETERRFEQFMKMLERSMTSQQKERVFFVMEKWVDKEFDFNYQILVHRDGQVSFHFVKEAIVKGGVHSGHRIPARLTEPQVDILRNAARKLGQRLHQDGYCGIVGIDGILGKDGVVYPNLEINARFNMSTYQTRIQELLMDSETAAIAKHYTLKLERCVSFKELQDALREVIYTQERANGLLINNFATLNAAYVQEGEAFTGRLYGIILGKTAEEVACLDAEIHSALQDIERGV